MKVSEENFNKVLKRNAELLEQVKQLTEQEAYLTHKMNGRHSEKMDISLKRRCLMTVVFLPSQSRLANKAKTRKSLR